MELRQHTEQMEEKFLSPYAVRSKDSQGRFKTEWPCSVRTSFQRDRDRIIHSKAFRRLKHKTQVFISPAGDHYRTRLTHTLEVAQIARTIARALRLNEDLTEAIALGHDLGHTPFGHAGEMALNEVMPQGFRHNQQSLRVVDKLEGGQGLNLTQEVRCGILKHTGLDLPQTLEGQVVRIADQVAYINHDIDDAMRSGVLKPRDLPRHLVQILGDKHGVRINNMVMDLINNSQQKHYISMSKTVQNATEELRKFLFQYVYVDSLAKSEESKARHVVTFLYQYWTRHPEKLPLEYRTRCEHMNLELVVGDYIAGMTDRYAIDQFKNLFIPRSFYSPQDSDSG